MIIIKEVEWDDCFSYGSGNYLKLDDTKITQILGENGAGKSSIALILEELFYGKNSKGIKKASIANRNIGNGYRIKGTFSIDADEYTLEIVRKSSTKIKLTKNGVDISSHTGTATMDTVAELLGLDFKTFVQLINQNAEASLKFLTATDTARKKFLIDLLHLEKYTELFEIFKNAVKECSTSVTAVDSKVSTIKSWLDKNKLEATDIAPIVEIHFSTEEDETILRQLEAEFQNISSINSKISKNNLARNKLKSLGDNPPSVIEEETKPLDEEMSSLGSYKAQRKIVEASISKMELLGNVCKTCLQEVPASFKEQSLAADRENLSELQAKITALEIEIESIRIHNSRIAASKNAYGTWKAAKDAVNEELPSELLVSDDYEASIKATKAKIAATKKEIAALQAENESRRKNNAKIQVVQEQSEKLLAELSEATAILDVETERLAKLEVMKKTFSTNGLVAHKIENLVKELELDTNDYLAELSGGRFSLEFVISNEKLNVDVTDGDKTISIEELSTGQLARVNTATLLAIRKLMKSISSSKLNILFLDEVISVLDSSGKEKLVEVLLKEDLNIFIVSHGWTHPLLEKIEILQDDNGISYIER